MAPPPLESSDDRARSSRVLHAVDTLTTRSGVAVLVAVAVVATWIVVFVDHFDEQIQLAFATVCSGITVTMVFVIQHTQRREQATQLKLDELIRSLPQADDRVVRVEASSDAELDELEDRVVQHHRAQRAGDANGGSVTPTGDRLPAVTEAVHSLRAVELDFLDDAPHRFDYAEPIAAPPAAVFAAIGADPSTWSWFPGVDEGSYEGDGPPGVGTRRWVHVGGVKYRETMLAWDEPRRWAYRVDETSAPVFAALLEDWVMEPAEGGTTTLRWTFAFDPLPETAALMTGARELIGSTFHDAARGLDARLRG